MMKSSSLLAFLVAASAELREEGQSFFGNLCSDCSPENCNLKCKLLCRKECEAKPDVWNPYTDPNYGLCANKTMSDPNLFPLCTTCLGDTCGNTLVPPWGTCGISTNAVKVCDDCYACKGYVNKDGDMNINTANYCARNYVEQKGAVSCEAGYLCGDFCKDPDTERMICDAFVLDPAVYKGCAKTLVQ